MKRKAISLAGDKWISSGFQMELSFRNEDKDGARLWGRGYDCANYVCAGTQNAANTKWAVLMVPEPVNFNMKTVDAKLNFITEKLFVSAGYYGSFFGNDFGNVTPSVPNQLRGPTGLMATLNPAGAAAGNNPAGGTSLQGVLQLPMALPPDNQAHQVYLSGNYAWTPTTRSNFKLAYTHATQNQDFGWHGLYRPAGGVAHQPRRRARQRLAQFGLTTQPINRLTCSATCATRGRTTRPRSTSTTSRTPPAGTTSHIRTSKLGAKVEAGYLLPYRTCAPTAGFDYERIKRELPDAATVT